MITPSAAAVIFILFMEASCVLAVSGYSLSSAGHRTHSTGAARAASTTVLRMAGRRYEMTDTQHEAGGTGGSMTRLTPGEIFTILAFWAFLVVLTAAGLLIDPRVAAVAAMRAALRPEVTSGIDRIALVEYGLWAGLTLPIFWMTRRFGGDRPTLVRVLALLVSLRLHGVHGRARGGTRAQLLRALSGAAGRDAAARGRGDGASCRSGGAPCAGYRCAVECTAHAAQSALPV